MPELSDCGRITRQHDPDRFLITLFARPAHREPLFALWAFNHEVAKTREVTTEPLLGEIRLQWWREALTEAAENRPRKHEVVEALAEAIRAGLDPAPLHRLIDARARDWDDTAFATTEDWLAYAAATSEPLADAAAPALGQQPSDAARAALRGYAVTGLLRAAASRAAKRRPALPQDVMAAHGVTAEEVAELRDSEGMRAMAAALSGRVETARAPKPLGLHTVLARNYTRRLRAAGHRLFSPQWAQAAGAGRVFSVLRAGWLGG